MLTNVQHVSVSFNGVHKISRKSMNGKWRYEILKKYHFWSYRYKQLFKGACYIDVTDTWL